MSIVHSGGPYNDLAGRCVARDSSGRFWCVFPWAAVGAPWYNTILACYSDDNGATWTTEIAHQLLGLNNFATPTLAIDSLDNVHVVFSGDPGALDPGATNSIIYVQRAIATGLWGAPRLVNDPLGARSQVNPHICIDSFDIVHVCWSGTGWGANPNQINMQYKRRIAGVWQAQEAITDSANQQGFPSFMAIDFNDVVHVVWAGFGWGAFPGRKNLQYRQRLLGVWQAREPITDIGPLGTEIQPGYNSIAIDASNNVHVVWSGDGWGVNTGIYNIQYRERRVGVWQAQVGLTDVANPQYRPSISIDSDGDMHVVWRGRGWGANPGVDSIQYLQFTGGVWQAQVDLINRADFQEDCYLLWSSSPIAYGASVAGYAFIWRSDTLTAPKIEFVSIFVFPGFGIEINKAFALSREEL